MITLAYEEREAAVLRLDADLVIAAIGAGNAPELRPLRRRVVAAYRSALAEAAVEPFDARWNVLALNLGSYVAALPDGPRAQSAAAARVRLGLLRLELLPELLELSGELSREARVAHV
jgi:hypothetical protein